MKIWGDINVFVFSSPGEYDGALTVFARIASECGDKKGEKIYTGLEDLLIIIIVFLKVLLLSRENEVRYLNCYCC